MIKFSEVYHDPMYTDDVLAKAHFVDEGLFSYNLAITVLKFAKS
jgi:hypothetical protein